MLVGAGLALARRFRVVVFRRAGRRLLLAPALPAGDVRLRVAERLGDRFIARLRTGRKGDFGASQRHSILSTPRIVAQCPGKEQTNGYSPGSVGASNVTTVDSPAFSSRDATRTFGESGTKPRSCAFGSFSDPNSSFS